MQRDVIDEATFVRLSSELTDVNRLSGDRQVVTGTHPILGFVVLIMDAHETVSMSETGVAGLPARSEPRDAPSDRPLPMSDAARIDRRAVSRKKAFRIAFAGGTDVPEPCFCLIRDMSPAGAMIEVGEAETLPACFELQLNGNRRSFRAEVRWRQHTMIGLSFAA